MTKDAILRTEICRLLRERAIGDLRGPDGDVYLDAEFADLLIRTVRASTEPVTDAQIDELLAMVGSAGQGSAERTTVRFWLKILTVEPEKQL